MNAQKSQSGFSAIEIAIGVAIVAIVGFLGYTFYTSYKASTRETVSTQVQDVTPAPAITTADDLDKASTTIEQTDMEAASMDDLSDVENELSEF